MEKSILELADYLEGVGTTKLTLILILGFISIALLLYFSIALDTHLSHSPLGDFFKYGKYEVLAENQSINENQVIIVRAMNKISAIEKAANSLEGIDGYIFKARRL